VFAALDWTHLIVRVVHFAAGIAWIGSSFYFIWLDRNLTTASPPRAGVDGELWMVHSGGFYLVERRRPGIGQLPAVLHWFKWEAMLTWASGMLLLAIIYYVGGGSFLLDPAVSALTAGQAALLSLTLLVVGWFVYDGVWRSPLARAVWPAAFVSLLLFGLAVFGLFGTLSGRAAYIHVGALLGTLMVANVWAVILPAQQRMIDATGRGEPPDPASGEQAKRRSVHNSYMTFPVLFLMVSSHFPQTWGNPLGWLILLLLAVAGATVRHVMIARGPRRHWALVPTVASFAAAVALAAPNRSGASARVVSGGAAEAPAFGAVRAILNARCLACHSAWPTDSMLTLAPPGVTFDTADQIAQWAARIRERAVVQKTMPLVNRTGMTDGEREVLGRWVDAGARLR
jgi:uncharacterized membrane protein